MWHREVDLVELMNTMVDAADYAGQKIMEFYNRGFDVKTKDDLSPVTDADIASNKIIRETLQPFIEEYDFGWLSEEDADNRDRLKHDELFVVDPLDGTADFIAHDDQFTVNIAYVKDGRPIISVIGIPCRKILAYALQSVASWYYDENNKRHVIEVSKNEKDLTFVCSKMHPDDEKQYYEDNKNLIKKVIPMGACTKAFAVASGEVDGGVRFTKYTKEWDICAADLLVHSAGGYFLDTNGERFRYNKENVINPNGYYMFNTEFNKFRLFHRI